MSSTFFNFIALFGRLVSPLYRGVVSGLNSKVDRFGTMILFIGSIFSQIGSPPHRFGLIFRQLEFIGNQSFNIIFISSIATGAVFGLQIGSIFKIFSAESFMGVATGLSLCWEIAPLITGVLLAGRVGSAMTAEIATMKVNEQITAMEAMAVNPINYLVVPRFVASIVMAPLLCGIFVLVGMAGAAMVGKVAYNIEIGIFMKYVSLYISSSDLSKGLFKACVFGGIVSTVCCFYGLNAKGGAKGVGKATTVAVIITLLSMLGFDFVITYFQFKYG